ncbi:MAG: hypothetical protein EAZ20_14415 [Bacteroidetes bacterium]|nr:MAG: hypothetical protein EAZ20_14415 [Bacteroidota bacterium]
MSKISLLLFLLLFGFTKLQAQTQNPDSLIEKEIDEIYKKHYTSKSHNYTLLNNLRKIKNRILKTKSNYRFMVLDYLYYGNMAVGNKDSVEYYANEINKLYGYSGKKIKINHTLDKKILQSEDALEIILKEADKQQAIFINEAHHIAEHRLLTYDLLVKLRKKGYKYLAVEMFSNQDTLMNKRPYPIKNAISYADEPFYNNLVRRAKELGYTLVAYEEDEGEPDSSFVNYKDIIIDNPQKQRDWTQAARLKERILKKDKNAKILVHAGYSHIYEKPTKHFVAMAHYFNLITGINPLTIDQASQHQIDKVDYQQVTDKFILKSDTITRFFLLRDKKTKEVWKPNEVKDQVDLFVFHTQKAPEYRRAFSNQPFIFGGHKFKEYNNRVTLSKRADYYPFLFEVTYLNEPRDATATYQIEIRSPEELEKIIVFYTKNFISEYSFVTREGGSYYSFHNSTIKD